MVSEYIPTTTRVRTGYASAKWAQLEQAPSEAKAEFDRWLDEVKAQAWLEGYGKGFYELRSMPYGNGTLQNPYRGENK